MQKTKIEWAGMTWNPVTGCKHGCEYCYARRIANRFGSADCIVVDKLGASRISGYPTLGEPLYMAKKNGGSRVSPYPFGFHPTFHKYRLDEPKKVKTPQRIFVVSMGDLLALG